jgi:xylose isomerase
MDIFARALLAANDILEESDYLSMRTKRYSSFDKGNGKAFADGKLSLEDLSKIAHKSSEPAMRSGQQELFENILNQYI